MFWLTLLKRKSRIESGREERTERRGKASKCVRAINGNDNYFDNQDRYDKFYTYRELGI